MHSAAMHKPAPKLLQHRIDEQEPSAPLQCVHVCVCGVSALFVFSCSCLFESSRDVTQATLFFCVYLWPIDLTIVSPKASGREKEGSTVQ